MSATSTNASLKALNTFGLDVRADQLFLLETREDALQLISDHTLTNRPTLILGGGSNVLFTRDFHGAVLLNRIGGIELVREDSEYAYVRAGGGVNWHEFVVYTVSHGWGGLENLSLIPGTVGAAPIQNIGAYGVEIKDTFLELEAIELKDGSAHTFSLEECNFGYRNSVFKHAEKGRYLIISVTFRLTKNHVLNTRYGAIESELSKAGISSPTIKDVSEAVIRIRRSKLPDPTIIGNAGSFFKNPEVPNALFEQLKQSHPELPGYPAADGYTKLAAGYLIEQCGWKGKKVGHVGMHAQQALVLVNHGNATGKELLAHARNVQQSVLEKFGVKLEMEVNVVGEL